MILHSLKDFGVPFLTFAAGATMPEDAAHNCIFLSVATFLSGGFVGALIGHFSAIWRESRNRKRDLREFLGRWLHDVERTPGYNLELLYPVYIAGEKELLGHIAKLYGDFWFSRKFARLCAPLRQLLPKDFETGEDDDCRDVIAAPIKRLLDWI